MWALLARPLFRPPSSSSATSNRERASTALPKHRPAVLARARPASFYLSAAPRLRRFNHLADRARHRGTTPAAAVLPGLVLLFNRSLTLLESVTSRLFPVRLRLPPKRSFRVRLFRLDQPPRPGAGEGYAISAGRTKKHPLTHPNQVFALRPRLRSALLARPFGLCRVELFTAYAFSRTRRK